jgi:hypothetical protein
MFFWYSNILCEHGIFDDIGKENNDCVTPDHNVVFLFKVFSALYGIIYCIINLLHHVFCVHLNYIWYEGISGMYCFFNIFTKISKKANFQF